MIDTIELRFHGILTQKQDTLSLIKNQNTGSSMYAVHEHHVLYKKMLKHKHKLFSMVKTVSKQIETTELLNESDFLQLENTRTKNGFTYIKQVQRFIDEKKVKEMTMRQTGKYHVPSSIASVVFKINENGGFIDFTVSIPKYLYNHSLAEFIPQHESEEFFNMQNPESFNSQRKVLHKRLMKFIDLFLCDICDMFKIEKELHFPNKDYIELRRIDLCFNQYFKNKAESLNYLNHLRKVTKIKSTHTNNNLKEYDTSITYFTTSGAYFKIYHKGSEYVSSKFGDLKKHIDFNKAYLNDYFSKLKLKEKHKEVTFSDSVFDNYREKLKSSEFVHQLFEKKLKDQPFTLNEKVKKKANETAKLIKKVQPFKVQFLKDEMDKVLRYEISLRGDFFSYNFKRKIFRKDCPIYKNLKDNHSFVHSINQSNKLGKPKLTSKQLRDYKKLDSFYKRSIGLTFSNRNSVLKHIKTSKLDYKENNNKINLKSRIYRYTLLSEKDIGLFNNEMLQLCIDYFLKTIKSFQLSKLDTYSSLAEKVKDYNLETEKRIEQYNRDYYFTTLDIFDKPKIKSNRLVTKAIQLLTEKEKREKGLKKIAPLRIMQILNEMQKGKSLHNIRKELGISKSNFSRLSQDLKIFGIFENTLQLETDFNPELNFRQYYFNTQGIEYSKQFYFKPQHKKYG